MKETLHTQGVRPRKNHRGVAVIFAPAGVALGTAAADSPRMAFGSAVDFAAPLRQLLRAAHSASAQ